MYQSTFEALAVATTLTSRQEINNEDWQKIGIFFIENYIKQLGKLDQCWDRDIHRFGEFPEKSIILNLDGMTDMREAHKKLGENYCLMGDVPAPLLATGTPDEVRDYVTKLIDDLGPKGLFITAGCDAPGNTKHENMVAMFKATNDWK